VSVRRCSALTHRRTPAGEAFETVQCMDTSSGHDPKMHGGFRSIGEFRWPVEDLTVHVGGGYRNMSNDRDVAQALGVRVSELSNCVRLALVALRDGDPHEDRAGLESSGADILVRKDLAG